MKKNILCFCLMSVTLYSIAQTNDSIIFQRPVRSSTFFHINILLNLGVGFGQMDAGIIAATGESVKLSAGGGAGIGLRLGLAMHESNLDFSFGVSRQLSPLNPPLSNATGTFSRTLLEPMGKYLFWLKRNKHSINLGLGIDFAVDAVMDIDATKIPKGWHRVLTYKSSSGPVFIFEYQFIRKSLSLAAGLKFYSLEYDLASVTEDGINIPLAFLPPDAKKEYLISNGSGVDFYIGLGYNF